MLTLFRRHLETCPHRRRGRLHRHCKCPLHVQGTLRGEKIRRALDLTSWEAGQDRVRDWELGVVHEDAVTLADAKTRFLDDAEARKLSLESLKKYRGLLKQLEEFARRHGVRYLRQLDLQTLRDFRNAWIDGALSGKKKLERLRSFFRFALQSNWVKHNPVISIRTPRVSQPPTLPFSSDEMDKILWACDLYPDNGRYRKGTPARLKALVLLMRYSGLRIGDAATLEVDRIKEGRLFLYTQKTKVPVWCPLPKRVEDAFDDCDPVCEKYWFWNGASDKRSITGNWQRQFQRYSRYRVLERAHPHRFRDTFAVGLLEQGIDIETVAVLLGHSSSAVTRKHYNPWVKSRQDQLEAAVRKAW